MNILWAIVLLGAALVLFMLEVFIPSGGLIGMIAVVLAICGIVLMARVDSTAATITAILGIATLPALFALGIKLWPDSPVGRIMILRTQQQRMTDAEAKPPGATASSQLVGQTGQALSDLRPVGTCRIGDQRFECLASRGVIETGSNVRVVAVAGMEIKVDRV